MKRLILFLIILFLSVWFGINMRTNPGYVLIAYKHWSIETTLWFAVFSLIILFILLSLLRGLLSYLFSMTGRWQRWSFTRHLKRAQKLTARGLRELAEGNWRKAEKYLIKGADENEAPLINYLAAARAAQEQSSYEQRDHYLQKAYECNAGADEIAVGLTQAQLQLSSKQLERALATLQHLHQLVPDHSYVIKLLQSVYLQLQDWEALRNLLPTLKKNNILSEQELNQLEQQVYAALLENAANCQQLSTLTEAWENLPKSLRKEPKLLAVYAKFLIHFQENELAEELLRQALKKNWSPELIYYYGYAQSSDPAKQLDCAEYWLKEYPHHPQLLYALGQICARNRLWGKARNYLEDSIKVEPNVASYRLLGFVFEQMGDSQAAMNCYREGLQLTVPTIR